MSRDSAYHLTVDVNNTHTGVVVWDEDRPTHQWRLSSDPRRTSDELGLMLGRLMEVHHVRPEHVVASALASVVPALTEPVTRALTDTFGLEPMIIGPGVRTGLQILVEDPREVGPDRVANAVAARAVFGAPVLILDFATALTIDVLDSDGAYRGAVIVAGLEAAVSTLARRGARIGQVPMARPASPLATDTVSAVQVGAIMGYAGLVEGLLEHIRRDLGPARAVATGDATVARLVLDEVAEDIESAPLLTHDGMRRILGMNIES